MSVRPLTAAGTIGCFGKLPGSGDFLRRGLPRGVYDGWDRWLQQALLASREALGERWLEHYLVAPVWRFALGPGLLSPHAWLGLWLPSVDSVGRYFPFSVLAPLPEGAAFCRCVEVAAPWYDSTEQSLRDLLQRLLTLDQAEPGWRGAWPATWPTLGQPVGEAWAAETSLAGQGPEPSWANFLDQMLVRQKESVSLWWHGRPQGQPSAVLCSRGLPRPYACTAFFDGQWGSWSWGIL